MERSTPMWSIFGGVQLSRTWCKCCGHARKLYEPMSILLFGLPATGETSLTTLLKEYTSPEHIPGATCDFCSMSGGLTKQLHIARWPRNVVIGLKWWTWLPQGFGVKPKVTVAFPPVWSPQHAEDYRLTGIVLHSGDVGGGHNTACVADEDRWFLYDDAASPKLLLAQCVLDTKPYILLYHRLGRA